MGNLLRNLLPHDDLSPGSQEAVKFGLGFVATMSALVLGLLISSAKASYDAVNSEMTQMSARVIFLDRVLALYGPETKDARDLLRATVPVAISSGRRKADDVPKWSRRRPLPQNPCLARFTHCRRKTTCSARSAARR